MEEFDIDLNNLGNTNTPSMNPTFLRKDSFFPMMEQQIEASRYLLGIIPPPGYTEFQGVQNSAQQATPPPAAIDPNRNNSQNTNQAGNNQAAVWNYLRTKYNLPPESVAGIMGNMMQESSPNIDPKLHQRGGPGRGIIQWTESERWANLKVWAGRANRDPWDLYTQLDFMIHEMKTTNWPSGSRKGVSRNPIIINGVAYRMQRNIFSNFLTFRNIELATVAFDVSVTRSGRPMMEKRLAYANEVYRKFHGRDR